MHDQLTGKSGSVPSTVGGGVRIAALGVCLLEVAGTLVGSSLGPDSTGVNFGPLTLFQCLLVVAAAAALLWRQHWLGGALVALSTGLALTVQSIGSDHLLWLLVGVIAGLRGGWMERIGCFVCGTLVGFLAAWETSTAHPGWGFEVGAFLIVLVALGLLMGTLAEVSLRIIGRSRQHARALEQEAERIRRTERLRLADDLQTLLELGLRKLQKLSAQPTDRLLTELRAMLTSVDQMSRELLGQTRQLLHALRETTSSEARTNSLSEETLSRLAPATRIGLGVLAAATGLLGPLTGGITPASLTQLTSCAAVAVTLWRKTPGIALCIACLAATVFLVTLDQPVGLWSTLPTVVICLIVARHHPKLLVPTIVTVAVLVTFFVSYALIGEDSTINGDGHGWFHGYAAIAGILIGISWRALSEEEADAETSVALASQSRDTAIVQERQTLARELHDVVAHQLSITTMMIMASSASDERTVLIGVLQKLRRNIDSARLELDALLHGLRSAKATGPFVTPSRMAQQLRAELVDAGFDVHMDVDPAADDLNQAQVRTAVRTMQEAASNILRYASTATLCDFRLRVDEIQASLEITSALSRRTRRSELSNGMGLRGIRERVDLLSGTFHAGPQQDRWILSIQLPHSKPVPSAHGPALAIAQQAVLTEQSPDEQSQRTK
ncbi:MAG: histidine kinase [Brevibacterium aurantiacum]